MGNPGYTDVVVNIRDVNDNPPVFSKSESTCVDLNQNAVYFFISKKGFYQVSISEGVEDDSFLVGVSASDADSGVNEEITYIITSINTIGTVTPTDAEVRNLT